ncbi:hypothetical protein SS50377_20638 [Spironucleus salmonicida]|uniref:Transmembrane protein n=1 Tax=Spironucleus salmonicida TaxID=348837 RepID=A0A9P8M0F1_9EUKA|nr:hypothetical protein SS50377_20638 [Spironucleus salmonicida]
MNKIIKQGQIEPQTMINIIEIQERIQQKQQEIHNLEAEIKQLTTLNWGLQLQIDDLESSQLELSDIFSLDQELQLKQIQIYEKQQYMKDLQDQIQHQQKDYQQKYIEYFKQSQQITKLLQSFQINNIEENQRDIYKLLAISIKNNQFRQNLIQNLYNYNIQSSYRGVWYEVSYQIHQLSRYFDFYQIIYFFILVMMVTM